MTGQTSTTNRQLVANKCLEGKDKGAKWMIVVTDLQTYEEDFLFIMPTQDIVEEIRAVQREKHERQEEATEVFNLLIPIGPQLTEARAWNL